MTSPSRRVVLTDQERKGLLGLQSDGRLNRAMRTRVAVILELADGTSMKGTCEKVKCADMTATTWRDRWLADGVRGLHLRSVVEDEALATWAKEQEGEGSKNDAARTWRVRVAGGRWGKKDDEPTNEGAEVENQLVPATTEDPDGIAELASRERHEDHPAKVIKAARLYYCLGFTLRAVSQRIGLHVGLIQQWRLRKAPDGLDWDEYKQILDAADVRQTLALAAGQEQRDFELKMLGMTDRVLAVIEAGLTSEWLYDDAGNRVDYLRDEKGERVAVGMVAGMTLPQRVKLIRDLATMREKSLEKLEKLEDRARGRRSEQKRIMEKLGMVVVQVLGEEAWRKLNAAVMGGGDVEDDGGETAATRKGQEAEGDREDTEAKEEMDGDEGLQEVAD